MNSKNLRFLFIDKNLILNYNIKKKNKRFILDICICISNLRLVCWSCWMIEILYIILIL